jgi:hypothetical protein
MKLPKDGIVRDGHLAVKIGELLCDALYHDVAQQRPLSSSDKGTFWRVEGSRNLDGAINGVAEFFLSIEKSDGRVTDVGEYLRHPTHPSVVPLVNEHLERKQEKPEATTLDKVAFSASPADKERLANKSGAGTLLLTNLARGGVVFSDNLAMKIGETLCDAHYGDLPRQIPLHAEDRKTYWRVEGSWGQHDKIKGSGSFYVSINKYDARITDIGE